MLSILTNHYILLVLLIGFVILLSNDFMNYKTNHHRRIKELLLVIVALVISSAFKSYYETLDYYTFGRTLTTFFSYTLRPAVIILFAGMLSGKKYVTWLSYLCFINAFIYMTCFFNGLAFSITEDNILIKGPLYYSSYIFALFNFMVVLTVIVKQYNSHNRMRTVVLLSMMILCAFASYLDLQYTTIDLVDSVLLICGLEYYLYINMEYNKLDIMTKTYNRASFNNDIKKLYNKVTSILSVDMNDLKRINDTLGHTAGDKAIKTVASILLAIDEKNVRVYRIGGDEFAILCLYKDKTMVRSFITKAKEELAKTEYTCSFGYAYNDYKNDLYTIYKKADKKMYTEKEAFHEKYGRIR